MLFADFCLKTSVVDWELCREKMRIVVGGKGVRSFPSDPQSDASSEDDVESQWSKERRGLDVLFGIWKIAQCDLASE